MATQDISASMRVTSNTTAEDFKNWMKNVPDEARLSVSISRGDLPWSADNAKIVAHWTQAVD